MHRTQARVGGLMVITGFVPAFALATGWAIATGAVLLVTGGLVLAVAAEPMLDLEDNPAAEDAIDSIETQGGVAA